MSTLTISATDFKAKCLELMDRLASGDLHEINVTKRGRPVATMRSSAPARRIAAPGFLKEFTLVPDDFDWEGFRAESNRLWSPRDPLNLDDDAPAVFQGVAEE